MPKGVKPSPNWKGKKGRSGRKSKFEEMMVIIENAKKEVTQDALIALANQKVFAALQHAGTLQQIKDIGLPITLKGIKEAKDLNVFLPTPILGGQSNVHTNDSAKEAITTEEEN